MENLQDFLKNYDTVIFDMDGVITSEEAYWDSSALTVWEFINSKKYFGKSEFDARSVDKDEVRKKIFQNDEVITLFKKKGLNNNWDLAYITIFIILKNGGDLGKTLETVKGFSDNILEDFSQIEKEFSALAGFSAKRTDKLWRDIQVCFQEWYVGDGALGKPSLRGREKPIIDRDKLVKIFKGLSDLGIRLGIATGRPEIEALTPLENFGILEYIDKNSIITFDYVKNAEEKLKKTLTKPHPYMFLKAYLGADFPDEKIVSGDYQIPTRALGVGDAGSDILSCFSAKMDFCAVLTGVSGEEARGYFEREGAQYILKSLENFLI